MKQYSDIDLIRQTLGGEAEAFGELIRRYQDAVYATALHRIGNFANAQDIAQEAFIAAYRNLHALREPSKFPTWLHTITLRECSRWRRKQKETAPIGNLEEPQIMEVPGQGILLPDEELEFKELRGIVLNAVASLPEKAGEVVTMYYIDGLSYSEIADFLSVPASTVKGRLQMGRKQLKEEFIAMVEEVLKDNRPDEKFTEKVLTEAIEQAKSARERNAHDEVMQFCEKALEVLNHLEATEERKRTRTDVLNWQSQEWLRWSGEPEKALDNLRRAAQIAADMGDLEAQAKWLLSQVIAIQSTGNYQSMIEPLKNARSLYGKLDDIQGQVACDAVLDLVDLLPEGWERVDMTRQRQTGYGNHRFVLLRSAEALTYIDEPARGQKPWYDVMLPALIRRGYDVFRHNALLANAGQPAQISSFPPAIGDSWSAQIKERHYYEIPLFLTRTVETDNDTVIIPAGRFENCLRVVTVVTAEQESTGADTSQDVETYIRRLRCGTRTMWFAPGVELVKYQHHNDLGWTHNTQLTTYHTEDAEENDYFPLSVGNRWRYERYEILADDRMFDALVTEGYHVVACEDGKAHITCAMYSDLMDDEAQRDYFQSYLEREKDSAADLRAQAWGLSGLGAACARLGDMEVATSAYRQSDELIAKLGDAKARFDFLLSTELSCPVDFAEDRYERAMKIAEETGDLERQKGYFWRIIDFGLLRRRYAKALDAAKRKQQFMKQFGNEKEKVYTEAEIDLAQSLIDDPEGEHAIMGGARCVVRVKASETEIFCHPVTGILPLPIDGRPCPPIYRYGQHWIDTPVIKFPAKIGEKWFANHSDYVLEQIIEADNETVSVLAGDFRGAVRVRSILQLRSASDGSPQADEPHDRSKGFREGEELIWFVPGVGIVKKEFHHANGKRTIVELIDYHLAKSSDAHFPLAIGNRWCYESRSENGDLLFKEQERVVLQHKGEFYLACSGYTTNVAEYGEHKY